MFEFISLWSIKNIVWRPAGTSVGPVTVHPVPSNVTSIGGIEVLVGSGNGVGGGLVGCNGVEVGSGCVVAQAVTSSSAATSNNIFFTFHPPN
jgi:hypothetical protein